MRPFRAEERQEAALTFLKWFQTYDAQVTYSEGGAPPVRQDVLESDLVQEPRFRWMKALAEALPYAHWIPYLIGFGGQVFRAPPEDLTPTLDTPEAAQAAEWYANLLATYGPSGGAILHRRPSHAGPAQRPRQHPHAGDRLDDLARAP